MDIRPECVSCLMKRVLFQAKLADNGTEYAAVGAALRKFAEEYGEGRNSAEVATEVHRAAYAEMGIDPYIELKIRADEVAGEFVAAAEEFVNSSDDRIGAAILVAVIGNIMDFGMGKAIDDPDEFRNEFGNLLEQGIGRDDTDAVKEMLSKAEKVIYIFDNCGEMQLDRLLIKEIRKKGTKVVGVVRGEPILNDATLEDIRRTGIDKELDGVHTTSEFRIGINLKTVSPQLRKEIGSADLIISKGMANYESLSDQDVQVPLVYMLRTKCAPVADSLNMPLGINAVVVRSGDTQQNSTHLTLTLECKV